MNYYQKYMKYKNKYNELLLQSGGDMISDLTYNQRNGIIETTDYSNLENVISYPLGHHVFTDFNDDRSSIIRDTNAITVNTYPNFNALTKPKTLNIGYNKIPGFSTSGSYLNQYDKVTAEECADKCSQDRYCNSFNHMSNGKKKNNKGTCQHSINNAYFVPDIISKNEKSDFYQKNITRF